MANPINVATRIVNLQSGRSEEMYKETHSLYVIDNTPGLWRRLKPKFYKSMDAKDKEGHVTCRGVVGEEDHIYTFMRDIELEQMLGRLLLGASPDLFPDRDAFLEEENQPGPLPSPKRAVKKVATPPQTTEKPF